MWSKGKKTYRVKSDPFRDTEKFPHDKKPQYTPPVDDVLKLLLAADRKERVFLDCYIQTGARRSEIFRLIWDDVDFNNRSIRLSNLRLRVINLADLRCQGFKPLFLVFSGHFSSHSSGIFQ